MVDVNARARGFPYASRWATLVLCLTFLWSASPAVAAQAAPEGPAPIPAPPSTGDSQGAETLEGSGSTRGTGPRTAVDTFFKAMERGDLAAAAATFEEGSFEREEEAEAAARALYHDVFLHTRRLSLHREVEEVVQGDRYLLRTAPDGMPWLWVELELVRRGDAFVFARQTLDDLPRMVERLAGVGLSESVMSEVDTPRALAYRLRATLPAVWLERSLLLENWQWVGLFVALFLAVVADRVMRRLVLRVALGFLRRRDLALHEEVLTSFGRPLGLLTAALVFDLLLGALALDLSVREVLGLAAGVFAAVAGVWAAYRLVDVFCDHLDVRAARTANKFDDMLVPLARRTLKLFVVVVGLVFVSSRLSEDVWGVVAGLGLGSLAVGFAARDSIENLFGTFTVLLDKPFQIGDWVLVDGIEGTVELVGFRSTRIRTFYNSLITVPNRAFIASTVDNMGERVYRRIKTTLGLTYDTPPETVEAFCEGVREIVRSHPYTRKDYYHVYLNGFGPSSLDVLLYCFVETPDWATELREKHRLFADILRLAEQLGVSFAFPTQTLHVAKPEDLVHSQRPESDAAGGRLGLKLARELVDRSSAAHGGPGEIPPPVEISSNSPYGDDGADGG